MKHNTFTFGRTIVPFLRRKNYTILALGTEGTIEMLRKNVDGKKRRGRW